MFRIPLIFTPSHEEKNQNKQKSYWLVSRYKCQKGRKISKAGKERIVVCEAQRIAKG